MTLTPQQRELLIDFVQQDFIATQRANPSFVYRCLLVVKDGEFVQVLFTRVVENSTEQLLDLARAGILIPLVEATDAVLVSDAYRRTIDPDSVDPVDNPASPAFLTPSQSPNRVEVLIVEHYWVGGHDGLHFEYARDSAGHVQEDSFTDVTPAEFVWSSSHQTMQNLFRVPLDLNESELLNPETYIEWLKTEGFFVRRITL